jgi:PAS domain S-box-containing protein
VDPEPETARPGARPQLPARRPNPAWLAVLALLIAVAGTVYAAFSARSALEALTAHDLTVPLLALVLGIAGVSLALILTWYLDGLRRRRDALMLAQVVEGVLLVDPNSERIRAANPSARALLGYSRPELTALRLCDIVVQDEGLTGSAAQFVLRTQRPYAGNWSCRRRDGTVVELAVRAALFPGRWQSTWSIALSDLTESQRLQVQLRASQARFRVLFERSAIGIALIDLEGRVTGTNPSLQVMLGYSADELRGMDFISVTHPDSRPADQGLWRDLTSGKLDRYETERSYVHKAGQAVWVRLLVSLVRGAPGEPEFAICMVEDITQRRRDADVLAHRARELAALYETSLAINAQPNLPTLLNAIVARAAELLDAHMGGLYLLRPDGQMLEMVVSHHLPGMASGTLVRLGEGFVGRVGQSGEPIVIDDYRQWQGHARVYDGNPFRRVIGVPLKLGARVIGVLAITDDRQTGRFSADDVRLLELFADQAAIAVENARLYDAAQHELVERKRAEAALRQSMIELQARNEDLDAFAHTVAHDLQNPLSTLIGFANALESDYGTLAANDMRTYLRTIGQTGRKMSNIVRELLLLAGVRKTDVARRPLDMALVVSEARERLAYEIREYQAQVHIPVLWPRAIGYAPWIEEVWVNYISNALKYGGKPPQLELGSTVLGDGRVRFWVRDNGRGLTPEEQASLFTPFTRVSQARVTGHGLGLSIVKRIVEKLDGEVAVDSEVGKGSTFSFTLPAAK